LILVFIKDNYRRKLFIAPTICAYVLAALLPYLLTWSSPGVTILFYALVIGTISFFTYDRYKSALSRTYDEAVNSEPIPISELIIPVDEVFIQPEVPNTELEATVEGDLSEEDELHSQIGLEQTLTEVRPVDEDSSAPTTEQEEELEEAAEELKSVLSDDTREPAAVPPQDTEPDTQPVQAEAESAVPEDTPPVLTASLQDTEEVTQAVEADESEPALPEYTPAAISAPDAEADIHKPEADVPEVALLVGTQVIADAPEKDAEADIRTVEAEDTSESTLPDDIQVTVTEPAQVTEPVTEPVETDEPVIAAPEDIPVADIHTDEADVPVVALPDDIPVTVTEPAQDTDPGTEPVEAGEPETAAPEDIPVADIHTDEADVPVVALPDGIPVTAETSPQDTEAEPLTVESEEPMIEDTAALAAYDIEYLIELAFEARARGDYRGTLTILETILEKDPPDEIVSLILDDVEVLFAKLAS